MIKKLFATLLVAAVAFMSTINVYAMSESELLAKAKQTYTVNGKTAVVPAEYIKTLEDYLNSFAVTEADCQYLANKIDELYTIAQAKDITTVEEFRQKAYSEAKTIAADITANTKMAVTLKGNGTVTVSRYDDKNTVFVELTGTTVAKNTGSASLLYVAGIITVLGASALVYKVRKA